MKIIAFPYSGIAYNDSFYRAVEAHDVRVVEGHWEGRWLLKNIDRNDVIHIHWPSFLYESDGTVAHTIKRYVRFLVLLSIVTLKTRKLWWTAHNLFPHNPSRFKSLDIVARKLIIYLSKGIFVHGPEAESVLEDTFPGISDKCHIIPHGNWIGEYPPGPSPNEAKKALGIREDAFVYLLFGQCKPYKNIHLLVETFKEARKPGDHLIVAGKFSDPKYFAHIQELVADCNEITVDNRFIPHDEVSKYLTAADVFCIPYAEILTSGSAMLSLSYGVPVISISKGFLKDIISDKTGILMSANDKSGLLDAINRARTVDWSSDTIKREAAKHTYEEAASIFISKVTED